jgi:NAD+ synthase (glutamine-hydrolysing)
MCQINTSVGDIKGNVSKITGAIGAAKNNGADIVIFPEMAVTGYPPEDLLLKKKFIDDNIAALKDIIAATKGITAVVGYVNREKSEIFNSAAVIRDKKILAVYNKVLLPNYGVFDEKRYFESGRKTVVFNYSGTKFGVTICEDIWQTDATLDKMKGRMDFLINISASPYHMGKGKERTMVFGKTARHYGAGLIYVNLIGGQDELVFDGHSLVLDKTGKVVLEGKQFEEEIIYYDIPGGPDPKKSKPTLLKRRFVRLGKYEEVYNALVTGTRDYIRKNGFKKIVVALSGGIDSAIVSVIAAEAVGGENLTLIFMPTKFSSKESYDDAKHLADNLKVELKVFDIQELFDLYLKKLSSFFEGMKPDTTEENLQARIRGNIVMALSNKYNALVLTTGNKSEMSTGYATLYGDMAGGFAVIKDVPKTLVYAVSQYINEKYGFDFIPKNIISKAPTAELKFDQKDQDTLPPYDILDNMIGDYVERDKTYTELKNKYDHETLRKTLRMIDFSEYKRRQAAPGIKITPKAYGRDRRMPITNKYKE